jgi:uncharacterized protein (TIGR02246 family)
MRHANPVPDQAELADAMLRSSVFLTATKETSMSIDTDQPTHETPKQRQPGTRRNLLAALGAFAVAVVAVAVVATFNTGDDIAPAGTSDDPAAVIEQYTTAYNSGDIDAIMAVFTEDSVLYGFPGTSEAAGLTVIRRLYTHDLANAASTDAYSISNVEVDGDTVTWDQLWVNKEGKNYCMEGQSAVIKDGKILTWTWPSDNSPCP